jgi:large subunit ribosomal protein L11
MSIKSKVIELTIQAGKASAAPPIGPVLSKGGVNIPKFIKEFNDKTRDLDGAPLKVYITPNPDKSFTLVIGGSPTSYLLKKAANVESGSSAAGKGKPVGKVTKQQIEAIAKQKWPELEAATLEAAMRTIEGTARSVGLMVEEVA